ncbi:protein YgfX [Parendozoicomonas sp. Alg238-R29]|uniref:protein YgfX n=1 Tax=Parendozoicomonas sp. Alg238-R29 TaxID=2993446 RepID=UPI00248D5CDC|nr:protein YgfX [Parendozoicomonas sp. Alg238-R29]
MSELSIDLQLGQSALWLRLALGIHISTAVIPLFSVVAFWFLLMWPLIALSFFYYLRRDYWRCAPRSVKRLRFYRNSWKVQSVTGAWFDAEPVGEKLITPFLTTMSFRVVNGGKTERRKVVIFKDSVHPEPFRQLRMYLLLGG